MEVERIRETVVALYTTLADAEAALSELERSGVPYPDIRLAAHAPGDPDLMAVMERAAPDGITTPDYSWSLAVALEPKWADKAVEVLRKHQPIAIGTTPAPNHGRGDSDSGAIAWRHYVFKSSAATDAAGESAGTTGTTGVISSGAFANDAKVEGSPPAKGVPAEDQRPSDQRQPPTSDTMAPDTSSDRSRPETELKSSDKV
jgi:hypothetical protein